MALRQMAKHQMMSSPQLLQLPGSLLPGPSQRRSESDLFPVHKESLDAQGDGFVLVRESWLWVCDVYAKLHSLRMGEEFHCRLPDVFDTVRACRDGEYEPAPTKTRNETKGLESPTGCDSKGSGTSWVASNQRLIPNSSSFMFTELKALPSLHHPTLSPVPLFLLSSITPQTLSHPLLPFLSISPLLSIPPSLSPLLPPPPSASPFPSFPTQGSLPSHHSSQHTPVCPRISPLPQTGEGEMEG